MTTVIRDTGTLVLIKRTLHIKDRSPQSFGYSNYLHKAETWYHRPLQKRTICFFPHFLKPASDYSSQI